MASNHDSLNMLNQIIAHILNIMIRLLNFTYRYEFIGLENKTLAIKSTTSKNFVYAVWHQNLIATILGHIGQPFTMVISESKDGELVAVTCEKFGYKPTRGSSTRGGKKALLEIIKNVKQGFYGAMAVDGPKGPVHVVKPGVIEIARQCNCPILPTSSYADRMWVFEKSWDQFRLPKPFSKFADFNISDFSLGFFVLIKTCSVLLLLSLYFLSLSK